MALPGVSHAAADCSRDLAGRWEAPDGSALVLRARGKLSASGYRIDYPAFDDPDHPGMRTLTVTDSGWWRRGGTEPGFHGATWRRIAIGFDHPQRDTGGFVTTELTLECTAAGPVLFDFIGDPDEDRRLVFRRRD